MTKWEYSRLSVASVDINDANYNQWIEIANLTCWYKNQNNNSFSHTDRSYDITCATISASIPVIILPEFILELEKLWFRRGTDTSQYLGGEVFFKRIFLKTKTVYYLIKIYHKTEYYWKFGILSQHIRHHHHIALVARISLTLSRHSFLSFIALGRSSGQQPVSSHSCWMYVRAGRPAFARPCVGIHADTYP